MRYEWTPHCKHCKKTFKTVVIRCDEVITMGPPQCPLCFDQLPCSQNDLVAVHEPGDEP